MRFGIPLLANRVAPRCTFADSVLVVTAKRRRIQNRAVVPLDGTTWVDLAALLTEHQVDTLICGGISPTARESIRGRQVSVIDNVAGTVDEVLDALQERGQVPSGFGLGPESGWNPGDLEEEGPEAEASDSAPWLVGEEEDASAFPRDCMECKDRVCLQGKPCPYLTLPTLKDPDQESLKILESAWDVALENERTLCRLAELVYFALEMGCQRVGIAFCIDLLEPASILTDVLKRFFEVIPVCCKVRGIPADHPTLCGPAGPAHTGDRDVACDPVGMAEVLNSRETDLNVLVGLCVGVDSVFARESNAPVTTVFVKDKSLANNPIGAVYSH
ncbi:DUF1847 domain-containing protein, partial [Gemmatimonadota bacterium]